METALKPNVNIRTVAERAGVSTAAVSRVLNKKQNVSAPMREKVLSACHELGYRLNPSIQDLVLKSRHGVTRNVALVLAEREFADPAYARLVDQLADTVNQAHYQLLLVKLNGGETSLYDLPPVLRDARVDGILLTGNLTVSTLALVQNMGLPYVTVGNYDDTLVSGSSNVRLSHGQLTAIAVNQLQERGCRRLAFADENPNNFSMHELYETFRRACDRAGVFHNDSLVYWGKGPNSGLVEILEPTFRQSQLPFDGLFCFDYRQSEEIACLARGRCGLGDELDFTLCSGRYTYHQKLPIPALYIDFNTTNLVETAFQLLVEHLEGKTVARTIIVNYQ